MNPGDKVQVYRPGKLFHGYTGTILRYRSKLAVVELDDGAGEELFVPYDLQPLEDPS